MNSPELRRVSPILSCVQRYWRVHTHTHTHAMASVNYAISRLRAKQRLCNATAEEEIVCRSVCVCVVYKLMEEVVCVVVVVVVSSGSRSSSMLIDMWGRAQRDAMSRLRASFAKALGEVEKAYTQAVKREESLYFDMLKGDGNDEWSISGYYQGAEDAEDTSSGSGSSRRKNK